MEWVARRGRRADGKERGRRIPVKWDETNERRSQLPFCLAPSTVALILTLACVARLAEIGTAIRALANTEIHSNAAHSSFSTVSREIRYE